MRRPAVLFGLAGLMLAAHVVCRTLGFQDHTSAIAGMPISPLSNFLGPLHIAIYMLVVAVAPVLVIAGTLDTLLFLRRHHAATDPNELPTEREHLVQTFKSRLG
jgi:hypothetical protein